MSSCLPNCERASVLEVLGDRIVHGVIVHDPAVLHTQNLLGAACATRRSCVTTMRVVPCFWLRSASSAMISSPAWVSRLPVGSSARINAGSIGQAHAPRPPVGAARR